MFKVGLICPDCDYKGIAIQGKRLKHIFDRYIPEYKLEIYSIPFGSAAHQVDKNLFNDSELMKWIKTKNFIITIELFMSNVFEYCHSARIKTIWIPNKEWIPVVNNIIEKFPSVDIIMPTTKHCAEFMKLKFGLNNIIHNQLAFDLPITSHFPDKSKTAFIHNAGLRGVGDRRNTAFVCEVMDDVLKRKKNIYFLLKSLRDCPVDNLKHRDQFEYINYKLDMARNLCLYSFAEFSLAPSKWEGNGFAIIESLHYGTPVLTVDAPPMNEWVIHKETGYLCSCEEVNIELPLPLHGGERINGVGWCKAVHTTKEEMKKGIYWLTKNKEKIYKKFDKVNKLILEKRLENFIKIWKRVLNGR